MQIILIRVIYLGLVDVLQKYLFCIVWRTWHLKVARQRGLERLLVMLILMFR
jgi:hypothetical protein